MASNPFTKLSGTIKLNILSLVGDVEKASVSIFFSFILNSLSPIFIEFSFSINPFNISFNGS